jgi:hypothetical protein
LLFTSSAALLLLSFVHLPPKIEALHQYFGSAIGGRAASQGLLYSRFGNRNGGRDHLGILGEIKS